jgi:hypothetical protein
LLEPRPRDACGVTQPAQPDALDEVLREAGLDRCSLGVTAQEWSIMGSLLQNDPTRLPWFLPVHDEALRAPPFARGLVDRLDRALTSASKASPVADALRTGELLLGGTALERRCVVPFELDARQPLAEAVARVVETFGGAPDRAALEAAASGVPLDVQRVFAEVVLAAGEAEAAFRVAIEGLDADDLKDLARLPGFTLRSRRGPPSMNARARSLYGTRLRLAAMSEAAVRLASRIEAAKLTAHAGARGFAFDADTPIGKVILRDAEPQTHAVSGAVLAFLDTGGDDTYRFGAGAVDGTAPESQGSHVSVAIDLAGRDSYGYVEVPSVGDTSPMGVRRLPADAGGRLSATPNPAEGDGAVSLSEVPRQGAARLGIGMLFDLGAEGDRYRSLRFSQGYAAAGVGVLFDAGGDDVYEGEAAVQGAAHFGLGMLLDVQGKDRYRAYSQAQGFAQVRAAGVLYDGDGDDVYDVDHGDPAEGGDPLYWTIQIPGKANNSFAQGASWGRRAPQTATDTLDMGGGVGLLRDRRGNDGYTASVQAQASGYWFGTGILADGAGDDRYDGRYYVQAAGAHFALALFLEDGGNDQYNQRITPKATSIGVGHDFTTALHLDFGGNDVYRGPGLSLGAGNANGIGLLINVGGDDVYRAPGEPGLGAANLSSEVNTSAARRSVRTTGIFLDVGGRDSYEMTSNVPRGNDMRWRNNREPPASNLTTEHGAGLDVEGKTVALP